MRWLANRFYCARQEGFTLIEAMIAMLVGAVILLALGGMLIMAIRTNQLSEHRMEATALAQSIMDNVATRAKSLNYTQAQAQADALAQLPTGSIYTPTVTLQPTTVVAGPVVVHVRLSWTEHGVNKSVVLDSQVVAQ